jgi:hypothetical protein
MIQHMHYFVAALCCSQSPSFCCESAGENHKQVQAVARHAHARLAVPRSCAVEIIGASKYLGVCIYVCARARCLRLSLFECRVCTRYVAWGDGCTSLGAAKALPVFSLWWMIVYFNSTGRRSPHICASGLDFSPTLAVSPYTTSALACLDQYVCMHIVGD